MGNGITGGNEAIVHTLRDASEAMETNGYVILTIDASNAFNCIDRRLALETLHDKIPELYLTSLNTYGSPSYTVINGTKHPVEQGTSQGCPHAGSFVNVGLANLVDSLPEDSVVKHMWFFDDGYCYGPANQVMAFWNFIKTNGPRFGYFVNNKSLYVCI